MSTKKAISFSLILVGMFFLLNPIPILVDILPDFIGYLLILFGISRLANLLPDFAELKNATKKLLYISLSKLPALYFMFLIWGSSSGQRVIATTFTLSYAIVDIIFLIPFVHTLFDCFAEIGEKYGCDIALTGTNMRPEKLEKIAIIFFSIRCAFSTIPEFALVPDYSIELDYAFNWNTIYPFLAIVGGFIVIGFAIYFFVPFASYVHGISKTEGLQASLLGACGNEIVLNRRRYSILESATTFYIVGIFLTWDVYFDALNYVPDFFAAFSFGAALILLSYFNNKNFKVNSILSVLYFISTLVHSISFNSFYEKYNIYSIQHSIEAYNKYKFVLATELISEVLGLAIAVLFAIAIYHVIEDSVGLRGIRDSHNYYEKQIKKELHIKVILTTIFAFVCHCISFLYEVSLGYTGTEQTGAYGDIPMTMIIPKWDWLQSVVIICNILWVIFSLVLVTRIREESSLNLDIDS